jgi:hypothetical protein
MRLTKKNYLPGTVHFFGHDVFTNVCIILENNDVELKVRWESMICESRPHTVNYRKIDGRQTWSPIGYTKMLSPGDKDA